MSHDRFEHDDAAYVLGALGPTERRAFEEHMHDCETCARSVRDLAGMPGLLSQVDEAALESPAEDLPVPDTLLPSLLREVRRVRRRRLGWTVAGAAAAVLLGVAGTAVWTQDDGSPAGQEEPTAALPPEQEMRQVGQDTVRAGLTMESVPWGTRMVLTCTYTSSDSFGYAQGEAPAYALVVHTRDGRSEQVATWQAVPGKSMVVPAATAAARSEITSVDVRTTSGDRVLELTS